MAIVPDVAIAVLLQGKSLRPRFQSATIQFGVTSATASLLVSTASVSVSMAWALDSTAMRLFLSTALNSSVVIVRCQPCQRIRESAPFVSSLSVHY